jgi:hypothetical protein
MLMVISSSFVVRGGAVVLRYRSAARSPLRIPIAGQHRFGRAAAEGVTRQLGQTGCLRIGFGDRAREADGTRAS